MTRFTIDGWNLAYAVLIVFSVLIIAIIIVVILCFFSIFNFRLHFNVYFDVYICSLPDNLGGPCDYQFQGHERVGLNDPSNMDGG